MKKLVEYNLADGNTVWIEVDEPAEKQGTKRVSRGSDAIENAQYLLEDALSKIKPTANALVATIKDLGPDEATVEFGVKLSKTAGAFIVSANIEGTFVIKLTWKKAA